jgi:hypothetical protein
MAMFTPIVNGQASSVAFGTINSALTALESNINSLNALAANGAISSDNLADLAVITAKLAANAVTTAKLADACVTATQLSTGAVTTTKLADGNVTSAKLADGSVTSAKLADLNVTTAKIASEAVTPLQVAGLTSANGLVARIASNSFSPRTLTSGNTGRLAITNGDGVSGNPTLTVPAQPTLDGIVFPTPVVLSTNATTLDDYREGYFTPKLTFVTPGNLSVPYSTQVGRYTKVGNMVIGYISIILSSTISYSTASGNIRVTGLPYPVAYDTPFTFCGAGFKDSGGTYHGVYPIAYAGASYVEFISLETVTGNKATLTTTNMTSGMWPEVHLQFAYMTAY